MGRRVLAAVVVASMASVAAACGSGGDERRIVGEQGPSDPSTSSTATPGTTYGTVSTTTTVAASPELALESGRVAETHAVRTSFARSSINGTTYPNAMVMELVSYLNDWRVEIDAGRDFTRFRGDLGIPDDQASATAHRVDVVLDNGPPALSVEVRFGETKTIDLDVANVLRIRLVVSPISFGDLAIGNPRLVR